MVGSRSCKEAAVTRGSLAALLFFALLAGCFRHPHPDHEGRKCSNTMACPENYTCDLSSNRCTKSKDGGAIDAPADTGAAETLDGWSDEEDGADARETRRPSADGAEAGGFDVAQDVSAPGASDAPVSVEDANESDVPVRGTGGVAGGPGTTADAGGTTGSGDAGPGGAGGMGGVGGLRTGGATTGGTVSGTGGATVSTGGVAGTSTSGTGSSLLGGSSMAGSTTSPPDAAAGGGSVGTGGAGGIGGTATSSSSAPAPLISASVASLPLGEVVMGESSAEGTFTLTNTGNLTTGSLAILPSNGDFTVLAGGAGSCVTQGIVTLAPGSSCTVRVVFSPASASAAGTRSGQIRFSASPGNSGEVQVTGVATPGALLSVGTVTTVSFPTGSVGEQSAELSVTVSNVGPRATGTIQVEVPTGAPDFKLLSGAAGDCSGAQLAAPTPSAAFTCTVRVVMLPTLAGSLAGSLRVSASPGGAVDLTLAGEACPMYQHLHGTTCGPGAPYPVGNLPVPSAGCGTQGLAALLAEAQSVQDALSTSHLLSIASSGDTRTYIVDIPADYDVNKPYRVFFGFHGMGASAASVATGVVTQGGAEVYGYFGLRRQAMAANAPAIFIAPQSAGSPTWQQKDHPLFDDILAKISTSLCIDVSRIFVTGFSFGGLITYSLSTNHQSVIRAAVGIAPANYNIWLPSPILRDPIPWMSTTGMADGNCPWLYPTDPAKGAKPLALQRALDNGCDLPAGDTIPTWTSVSPSRHVCYDFEGCNPGYPVKTCTFNGGHQPAPYDGGTGDNGTESWIPPESWRFFAQF